MNGKKGSDGNDNTKISPETIMEIVTTGIEKEFANQRMKDFVQKGKS